MVDAINNVIIILEGITASVAEDSFWWEQHAAKVNLTSLLTCYEPKLERFLDNQHALQLSLQRWPDFIIHEDDCVISLKLAMCHWRHIVP